MKVGAVDENRDFIEEAISESLCIWEKECSPIHGTLGSETAAPRRSHADFEGSESYATKASGRRIGLRLRAPGFDRAIRQRLDWAFDAERCIIGVRKRSRPFREVPTYGSQEPRPCFAVSPARSC